MKKEEAEKFFKAWQVYVEFADKWSKIFHVIPESFLPYPRETLEEALNIITKNHFESGDKKYASVIESSVALWLWTAKNDEEALVEMKAILDMILTNPDLKNATLESLKKARESWLNDRNINQNI